MTRNKRKNLAMFDSKSTEVLFEEDKLQKKLFGFEHEATFLANMPMNLFR